LKLLKCKNVSFYDILKDINFELDYKENAIIYSGVKTGSTLFLKIIDNMVDNVKGEILFEGKNILAFNEDSKIDYSFNVSFSYEQKGLLHSMNVFDNIILPLKKFKSYDEKLLNSLIKDFQIKNILYKEPSEINDVETILVNIVRAIIVKPKLILYDEIDNGMDIDMTSNILNILEKYQNKISFAQIFTTVKNYPFSPYSKFNKKFKLFNKTLEKIDG